VLRLNPGVAANELPWAEGRVEPNRPWSASRRVLRWGSAHRAIRSSLEIHKNRGTRCAREPRIHSVLFSSSRTANEIFCGLLKKTVLDQCI
jgi:hypothetical protein